MHTRYLGKQKLAVSALGLGCMGMSLGYGRSDDQQSIGVIQHALEVGITLLDTSDLYGEGHNEELIRVALTGHPLKEKAVIATKCGFVGLGRIDGSEGHIKKACDASLKRLGVGAIDLYYLHRADKHVPIEESVGTLAELVKIGKVRHIGLSEVKADTLRRANKIHPITALQSEYSLWERKPEAEILSVCEELDIGFVPYCPLGRGFLSGKFANTELFEEEDFRKILPKFQEVHLRSNIEVIQNLIKLAGKKNCTPAQLALAWLLAQGGDIVPIPGTRSIDRLNENLGAINVMLSSSDVEEINSLIPKGATSGKQYPDEFNFEV